MVIKSLRQTNTAVNENEGTNTKVCQTVPSVVLLIHASQQNQKILNLYIYIVYCIII